MQTRRELTRAAWRVFARDGFEQARVESIASAAGKTRGAFYDHFRDKEDVFFAIFEEEIKRHQARAGRELQSAATPEERMEALTRHLMEVVRDRRWMLLVLEFKIYAIRRPKGKKKRLAELQLQLCLRGYEAKLDWLSPEFQRQTPQRQRTLNAQFGALLDGLFVNRLFDPAALDEAETAAMIRAALRHMAAIEGC